MVTKPRLAENTNVSNGLAAAVLFVVFAAVFLTASFPEPAGFPQDASLVAGIGYALIDLTGQSPVPTEGFLAAFEIVDLVLVGALVGAIMLASHEREGMKGMIVALTDGGSLTRAASEDGGSPTRAAGDDEGSPTRAAGDDEGSPTRAAGDDGGQLQDVDSPGGEQ